MKRNIRSLSRTVSLLAVAFAGSCVVGGDDEGSSSSALNGDPKVALGPGPVCPPPDGTRPDPTVAISRRTDPVVLDRFKLRDVLQQLITIQGVTQTPSDLYKQLWDTTAKAPGLFPNEPHCDDPHAINDFALGCPLPDQILRNGEPEVFIPTALTNRFDLAPRNGAHCGEYRIVFARQGGVEGTVNRDFIIFEGILPNPNPSCGIESCRPVVRFWENLVNFAPNSVALGDEMVRFYFTGLLGFRPVIHPGHYGVSGGTGYAQSGGQVRTNMFHSVDGQIGTAGLRWRLRETILEPACGPNIVACRLRFLPVTVKTNPFPDLFNFLSPESRAPGFQAAFPAEIPGLAVDDINRIGMSVNDKHNAGESNSQTVGPACGPAPAQNDDDDHCSDLGAPPNAFSNSVDSALVAASRGDLNFHNAFDRATTQTCAGCHQLSPGVSLGGLPPHPNPVWPDVRPFGFVHINETGDLSPALWCEFLPFRKTILDNFASSPIHPCPVVADRNQLPPSTGDTISGKKIGLAN